jgi:predicted RND superfamily exporter protein
MIQTSKPWTYMMQERAFVTSALQGIGISISFAFVVLIIATRNIIQSILSIFCVSVVIVSTVAIMNIKGWELGVAESVAVVV